MILKEAIVSVNENKQITEDFGRRIILVLSSKELEFKNLMYPVCMIDDYSVWRREFNKYWQHDSDKIIFWISSKIGLSIVSTNICFQ